MLVTNTVAFVRQFDELLFMRRGIVLERASYPEAMLSQESELYKLMYVLPSIQSRRCLAFPQCPPWTWLDGISKRICLWLRDSSHICWRRR